MRIDALLGLAAREAAERPAVIDGEREITYGELDAASSRLGHALRAHGVTPGERVGLFLEKSLEALIGVYGALKAGAVYVPLDEQAPIKRLAYIARDAGIRCLITSDRKTEACERLLAAGAPLETLVVAGSGVAQATGVTTVRFGELAAFPSEGPKPREDPDELAYILYTSGSTGEPKGVMLSHRAGLSFVDWAAREVALSAGDRLSSHAPLHFDLSTFDLFAAAWARAPVILVPRQASVFPIELAAFIREHRISVWYSVPSVLTQLVLRGELERAPLESLRVVIFAGEVFPVKYLRRLIELVPQARLYNFYGPTETNVCTWYEVRRDEPLGESLPIGRPIAGVQAIVQGADAQPVPRGDAGELMIRGPTVMHGYWGDPQRTARALIHRDGERVHRTGDLVRETSDGNLIFLGRRDSQVKTRGYRVELGEVEAAINAIGFVVECAVLAIPDELISNRLKAVVVLREGAGESELVAQCRDRLPAYMIPDEFELAPALPKSSTGKIDRRQLQESIQRGMAGHVGP